MQRLSVAPDDALVDQPLAVRLEGLAPGEHATLRATFRTWNGRLWRSWARFEADPGGAIDPERRSPLGLGLMAVREDEDAARATGVNVLAHKLLGLAVSTFFAGLAGAAFAYQQVSYYPAAAFSPVWTFDALLITYVGGLGTIAGPLIGALFFIVVQDQLALRMEQGHQIIFGVLFIVVVLVFPGGLVEGWHRLRRRFRA